ncbi:unnamed protein product [Brachionus calyciflorus]|uniref:Uncharacterized protein n=1 Tax=Brachionus calyciflorus TaxID=104777 RepID=A0A813MXA0_9BILA|nr:unnamed protein product [Brachionus calyciflorus]
MLLCLLVAFIIQLMFSVSLSHQKESLNSEQNTMDDINARLMSSLTSEQLKKNRLFPSDDFFKELIRVTNLKLKAHPNYKILHKFLKDLKKKKYDENFGEEEPYEDYSYQGKFRF